MLRIGFFCGALVCISSLSFAYSPCDDDSKKLCSSAEFHGETEKNCLHLQIEKVEAKECRDFLDTRHQEWLKTLESFREVQGDCKDDLEKLCSTVAKDAQRLKAQQTCLMSEGEKLSPSCKASVNRHIRSFQPTIREIP